jgi:phosphoribosyl 1,2-cyclic phosphodiesterase
MKLTFVGTRGEIEPRSRRHNRHSALLVSHRSGRVLIDCGADWLGRFTRFRPTAVVLTHAHPDHAAGLRNGAPCPVFMTSKTWHALVRYPIGQRCVIEPRNQVKICGMSFEAFTLEHSLIAPAVGWRMRLGRACFFYAPDVVSIHEPDEALGGVRLYIGDGASLIRPLVRKRGAHLIGHASMREQLDWCAKHGVRRAIFTHCGSAIVTGQENKLAGKLCEMAGDVGVKARIAHDGMTLMLR